LSQESPRLSTQISLLDVTQLKVVAGGPASPLAPMLGTVGPQFLLVQRPGSFDVQPPDGGCRTRDVAVRGARATTRAAPTTRRCPSYLDGGPGSAYQPANCVTPTGLTQNGEIPRSARNDKGVWLSEACVSPDLSISTPAAPLPSNAEILDHP
jgi:hypothetical protein